MHGLASLIPRLAAIFAMGMMFNAQAAKADTTFSVSGTCSPSSCATFSGTLTINVTSGTVSALDVAFPGFAPFTIFNTESASGAGTVITAFNSSNPFNVDRLALAFTTPTPGSLVNFSGGNIFGFGVDTQASVDFYVITGGTVSPQLAPVPLPGAFALFSGGLGLLGLLGLRKKGADRLSAV